MSDKHFYVYSRSGCGFCTRLVDFLENRGLEYTKFDLDKDYTREEFMNKFGRGSTFPQVLYKNEQLGGMKDTVRYISENIKWGVYISIRDSS